MPPVVRPGYTLYDVQGNALGTGSIVPGQSNTVTVSIAANPPSVPSAFEFELAISGSPAAGDSFTVAFNADSDSDNRNALALLDLQTASTIGKHSITSTYSQLIETVGAKASQAALDASATSTILSQATANRESVSGLTSMKRRPTSSSSTVLHGSGPVIKAAQQMFDTIINTSEATAHASIHFADLQFEHFQLSEGLCEHRQNAAANLEWRAYPDTGRRPGRCGASAAARAATGIADAVPGQPDDRDEFPQPGKRAFSIRSTTYCKGRVAVEAGSGALSDEDRSSIASELEQIENQLYALMNSKDANGRYLFAGSSSGTQPYVKNPDGTYSYRGNQNSLSLQVSGSMLLSVNDSGWSVFENVVNAGRTTSALATNPNADGEQRVFLSAGLVVNDKTYDQQFRAGSPYTLELVSGSEFVIRDKDGTDVTAEVSGGGLSTPRPSMVRPSPFVA